MTIDAAALQRLHHSHQLVAELRSRLARGPAQVRATEAKLEREAEQLARTNEQIKRTKLNAAERELQLKERESRILDIRGKLNSCSSNKEYQALIERIAADEQANSVLSDEILDLYEKISCLESDGATQEAHVNKIQQDLGNLKSRVDNERQQLEIEIGRAETELAKSEASLPGDLRGNYDRVVKAHGEEALAPLEDEVCGGCYQKVTSQMISELRMAHFVFCKTCGRLLYIPSPDV